MKKVQQVKSSVKSVLIYFFDTDGIIHKDFVPPGHTINVKFNCSVLRWLREGMKWRWPDKWRTNAWVCHHDNLPVRTTSAVQQFLTSQKHDCYTPPPLLT
jgi:hypothetical protein